MLDVIHPFRTLSGGFGYKVSGFHCSVLSTGFVSNKGILYLILQKLKEKMEAEIDVFYNI